jgi:hypothetical protein
MPIRPLLTAAAGAAAAMLSFADPARAAPFDGDWEGTLRCDATSGTPGIYEPALASVKGSQVKLLRGVQSEGEVLTGTLAGDGNARISGRTRLTDGSPTYLNFGGRFVPGRFEATGTAVPDGGGEIRTCSLALQPTVIARGEGAPPQAAVPEEEPPPAPPVVVYGGGTVATQVYGYPTWYDDNYWWRREMMWRWRHRLWARERAIRRYCEEHPRACGYPPIAAPRPDPPRPVPPRPEPPKVVDPPQGPMQPLPPKRVPPVVVGEPGTPSSPPQKIVPGQPPTAAVGSPSRPVTEGGVTVIRPEPPAAVPKPQPVQPSLGTIGAPSGTSRPITRDEGGVVRPRPMPPPAALPSPAPAPAAAKPSFAPPPPPPPPPPRSAPVGRDSSGCSVVKGQAICR